jgi:quercetin dioxygenase-like cupin family protein
MRVIQLYEKWVFHGENPYAEPLLVDQEKRILRFALHSGQVVREHTAPSFPVQFIILQGEGIFIGEDEVEHRYGKGVLLSFDSGEKHSIRALDEDLIFIAVLHGVPSTK